LKSHFELFMLSGNDTATVAAKLKADIQPSKMPKQIAFIINPAAAAGRCPARWAELKERLHQDGVVAKSLFTAQPGDAMRFAQELGRQCEVVVAVGGDGTLFEVASGLLLGSATNTSLGVVPLGTGNDAARQFGFRDPAQALLALRGARRRTVDVIRIGCQVQETRVSRCALLFAAVGIVSEALKQTTPLVKRVFGRRLAYPVGALRAIGKIAAPRMRVRCDGQTWEKPLLLVCASNGEFSGGGMRLAPGARMDDGLLDVNVCEPLGRAAAAALLWQIWRGRHLSHPRLRCFSARTVTVEADPPIAVSADGELIGQTPAQFEVVPQALRILIP
jgi:diacylglycerol kinase (ATP)